MKILHLCLSASYIEGLSYQENLLSQYHKKMGFDVYVLSSLKSFDKDGNYIYEKDAKEYDNVFGIHVKQLPYIWPLKLGKLLRKYKGTYRNIVQICPDIIFMHGVQSVENAAVVRYAKEHPGVKIFADNHSDFSNSATNWISKTFQHKVLWKHYSQKLNPYVTRFWGVLPARVDFLTDLYGLPKEKVDLLVMGADDEFVKKYSTAEAKDTIREKLGYKKSDFIIVTGGKIDQWKKQTLLLMDAVNEIDNSSIMLLVFGSIVPELKDEVMKRCSDKVKYIGWANTEQSYEYFACSDIVCFPGRHSVYWEQVAGQGIPMICKYWAGTTHVDCGGNVIFLQQDSSSVIREAILKSVNDISTMKESAKKCSSLFMYSSIAKKSIGC